MNQVIEQPPIRTDVIQAMREAARRGSTVRELHSILSTSLGLKNDALLGVLWYFMKAFCLPLGDVLPIREWLGTTDDATIDAAILPAIERSRDRWSSLTNGTIAESWTGKVLKE